MRFPAALRRGLLVAVSLMVGLLRAPSPARAGDAPVLGDSLRFRVEVGGSSDYTNEIYYLDSLATPTLTRRERFDLPQSRYAGVVLVTLDGTRAHRSTGYSLTQEVSIGDRLKRASLLGRWRQSVGEDWRILVVPRAEYRRDRTLGRDFEEYQASGSARTRRLWNAGATATEFGILGDWLHTAGSGSGLLLDRWTAGGLASLEHADYEGADWRIDYFFRGRSFPDSAARDHLEHETRGRLRFGWGIASFAVLDASAARRFTVHAAPTSLDNFWEETGTLDLVQNAAGRMGWPARFEWESVQFDLQDDVLYFNHQLLRGRSGARLQTSSAWTLELGPRAEWLSASTAPSEAYLEWGGYLEFEAIAAGTIWSATPAAGRRGYGSASGSTITDSISESHSAYRFAEVDLLGDQRLPGGWRARLATNARWEFHADPAENAGSLYFSLDVRRLF